MLREGEKLRLFSLPPPLREFNWRDSEEISVFGFIVAVAHVERDIMEKDFR